MNEIIAQLMNRKSTRAFEARELAEADRNLILEAACAAPTAGNQQLYTILDITDQRIKDRLAISCDNQPFIANAKLVLVFLADCKKWPDAFRVGGAEPRAAGAGDLLLAMADALIAAQNAVVAAESLGIGSCYIGDILERCEEHRALLNLPELVVPACMVVFGYPTDPQRARKKPERAPLRHIVHENQYRAMDGSELREMLRKELRDGKTYESFAQAFCQRKYDSDFAKEMTRSARVYLKDFQ